ncbi:uncharacterized protein V2V93DRAFT_261491 [Kockiozyma suomiensis]|uniref:uncharacterized protein n=1 Tax=Kockiozyma suomiensis TaxID=1337062 RepID=UPI003343A539
MPRTSLDFRTHALPAIVCLFLMLLCYCISRTDFVLLFPIFSQSARRFFVKLHARFRLRRGSSPPKFMGDEMRPDTRLLCLNLRLLFPFYFPRLFFIFCLLRFLPTTMSTSLLPAVAGVSVSCLLPAYVIAAAIDRLPALSPPLASLSSLHMCALPSL